ANETAPKACSVLYGVFVTSMVTGGAVLLFSARSKETAGPFFWSWMEPALAARIMWFCPNPSIIALMSRILKGLIAQVEMMTPCPSSQVLYPRAVAHRLHPRIVLWRP